MRCQRCGKPISPLRQLTDREFCSDQHRKRGALASASSDLRDFDANEDLGWHRDDSQKRNGGKMATSLALVMLLMVAGLVAARLYLPEGRVGGVSPLAGALPDASPMDLGEGRGIPPSDGPSARVMNWLEDHMPGAQPVRARSNFARGFDSWTTELRASGRPAAWAVRAGAAHPGSLRLWKPTLRSRDYDLRFLGEIQRRSLNWTYRAADPENYYATKLSLGKPGKENSALLTRLVVQGARTISRVELPMPVTLYPDRPYHVTVAVRGSHFLTLLDGHIIDDWSDATLGAGGVGFFSDPGEASSIHWVDFRERKGLLSKFFTTALLVPAPLLFDPLP
jgi:hypothetical protein